MSEPIVDPELSDLYLTLVGDARMKASQRSEHYKRKFIDTKDKRYMQAQVIWHNVELQLSKLLDEMNGINLNH